MRLPRRGEIRHVAKWNHIGHEATGDRLSLVVSPDWFNEKGAVVIVPLTTPGPNHENWWEPNIESTDSACLVPDIRTVPARSLSTSLEGTATPDEMKDVLSAFNRLTMGLDELSNGDCNRGEVWEVDLSNRDRRSDPHTAELMVLHYNPANCMAMTAFVSQRARKRSSIVHEISSSIRLNGRSVLLSQMRAIAADERLQHRIGTIPKLETQEISRKLKRFLRQRQPVAPSS